MTGKKSFPFIISLSLLILVIGCAEKTDPMTDVELILSKKLEADRIELTQRQVSSSAPSQSTVEAFLHLEVYNSKALERIENNEKLFEKECKDIANYLRDSITYDTSFNESEIRITLIKEHKFLFFPNNDEKTYSFQYSSPIDKNQ